MLVPYCGGDAHRCGVWCSSYLCSQRVCECTEESACWCHIVGVMHTGAVCGVYHTHAVSVSTSAQRRVRVGAIMGG